MSHSFYLGIAATILASGMALLPTAGGPTDPVMGAWRLNSRESALPWPKLDAILRRSFEPAGAGSIRISEERVTSDAELLRVEYVVAYDGAEYPIFFVKGDRRPLIQSRTTVSIRRLDQYTVRGVFRDDGRKTSEFTREVSRDGLKLYVRIDWIGTNGTGAHGLLVYDRLIT